MSMKKIMIGGMLVAGALSAEDPCNLVDCPPERSVCITEGGVATCVVQKFEFPAWCKSGQVFEGSAGSLDYPAGSGRYSNNEAACFYFKCANKHAALQWRAFSTESGYDFVGAEAVRGGVRSETLLTAHSGSSSLPSPTTVEGADGIFVSLESDYSVTASGFELDWTCQTPLSYGDVCYQFCEDGSCAPVNQREGCPADSTCLSSTTLHGFNSHHTCQLKAGSVCYQFCENPADCAPVNLREHCALGTECKDATTGFGFNSHHTCQEVLAAGEVCYQFCEDSSCAPIDKRDQCAKGTTCKGDGAIGFNSHETCQVEEEEELLSVGDVCYRFCEGGSSCVPVNKRDQCASGSECKPTGAIGFNSESTCQAVLSVGEICYRFCEGGSSCVFVDKRDECVSGTECKPTGAIGFNSENSCQTVLAAGEVCYQFCEDGSCAPINKRDQCASGTVCQGSGVPSFNSHETCVLSQ